MAKRKSRLWSMVDRVETAFVQAMEPFRWFMANRVDVSTTLTPNGGLAAVATRRPCPRFMPLSVLVPSFLLSEIARAFQIGVFSCSCPFLISDLVWRRS